MDPRALFHGVAASAGGVHTLLLAMRPRPTGVRLVGVPSKGPRKPLQRLRSQEFQDQCTAVSVREQCAPHAQELVTGLALDTKWTQTA